MSYKDKQELFLQVLVDEVSETETYVWKAEAWIGKWEQKWQLFKVTEDWNETSVLYADNKEKFVHSWLLRETYDYLI